MEYYLPTEAHLDLLADTFFECKYEELEQEWRDKVFKVFMRQRRIGLHTRQKTEDYGSI